jgi:WW domain-containing oxidoreductase
MRCFEALRVACVVLTVLLGYAYQLSKGPGGFLFTVRAVYFNERTGNDGSYGTGVAELTAEEVSAGANFTGKVAIVTGANTGIGLEMSRVMAMRGMRVVMACRSKARCEEARSGIESWAAERGSLQTAILDLSDLSSVRRFADGFLAAGTPLHFLVNNAGMIPARYEASAQGIELGYAVNTLAPFLLTQLLLPLLNKSAPSRVINVGSISQNLADPARWKRIQQPLLPETFHAHPLLPLPASLSFNSMGVYGATKTSMALITAELRRRLAGSGVEAAVAHPGLIPTNIGAGLPFDHFFMNVLPAYTDALGLTRVLKTVPQGASTILWAMINDISSSVYYADNAPHDGAALKAYSEVYLNDELAAAEWEQHERLALDSGYSAGVAPLGDGAPSCGTGAASVS